MGAPRWTQERKRDVGEGEVEKGDHELLSSAAANAGAAKMRFVEKQMGEKKRKYLDP
uniref:Uncharacterized protein n=1 Tax=Arundo donax TaxID=35708 RepID=A0A0A8ZIM0_ARUDO